MMPQLNYVISSNLIILNDFVPINSSKDNTSQLVPQVISLWFRKAPKFIVSITKNVELTFAKIFRKFVFECIKSSVMVSDYHSFTNFISINIGILFERFISIFLRFNIVIKNFDYKLF